MTALIIFIANPLVKWKFKNDQEPKENFGGDEKTEPKRLKTHIKIKENNKNKINMKLKNIIITIIVVIVLIAIFTNPSIEDHKEAVKNKFNANLQNKLNEEDGIVQAFTTMIGGAVLDGFVDNTISRDNYILFSTTKFTYEGENKVVGVGVFGNVFIYKKND